MKKVALVSSVFGPALATLAAPAFAHTGHGDAAGFAHGFAHPFLGLDHLLAMVAVGLWAAQIGGRALWAVPAAFVGVMALGGAVALASLDLPMVELGILGSVLILGALVALAPRLPLWAPAVIVGLFALFHGHAHGTEMPETASGLAYGLGFMAATAILHGIGLALGLGVARLAQPMLLRAAGGAVALAGLALIVG